LSVGEALLALAGLSFLGLGIQPPGYDWGRLLNEGLDRIYVTPIVVLGPAVAIVLAAVTFNLLGEALAKGFAGQEGPRWDTPPEGAQPEPVHANASTVAHPVLDLQDLTVSFPGASMPVRGVSMQVNAGEIVGIVGESGSGKSLTAMAIAHLLPTQARTTASRRLLFGKDPRALGAAERRRLLGRELAIVYQDPMSTLNPALRVGRQLAEVSEVHDGLSRKAAWARSVDRLRSVRIGKPDARVRQYPFEFSGGMRQRAVIAMGLMGEPKLIVADEPTTALDVTVQGQVLRLLRDVSASSGSAAIVISHDVAVVSQLCSRVLVMYAGRIVEELHVDMLSHGAAHPYTAALVDSVPTMESDRTEPLAMIPGRSPSPYERVTGCPFAPRCPRATEQCRAQMPPFERIETGQLVACWHPLTAAHPLLEGVTA
jgi:oligopeptide/dipeptide ABC transporter ATP-binding protein